MFYQPLFSITPKAFQAVDVNFAVGKFLMMIDFQMPVSTTHQSVIASEFISIYNGASPDFLDSQVKQSHRTDIGNNLNPNNAVPLKDTENRDFPGCPSAPIAFSSTSEVSLIQFDFTGKQIITVGVVGYDSHPKDIDCFKDSGIAQANLLGDLPGGKLQFKELDNPKPISAANPKLVNPASGKIMEGVFTPFTSKPFTDDPVDFIAVTSTAETTVLFPT